MASVECQCTCGSTWKFSQWNHKEGTGELASGTLEPRQRSRITALLWLPLNSTKTPGSVLSRACSCGCLCFHPSFRFSCRRAPTGWLPARCPRQGETAAAVARLSSCRACVTLGSRRGEMSRRLGPEQRGRPSGALLLTHLSPPHRTCRGRLPSPTRHRLRSLRVIARRSATAAAARHPTARWRARAPEQAKRRPSRRSGLPCRRRCVLAPPTLSLACAWADSSAGRADCAALGSRSPRPRSSGARRA